MKTLYKNLYEGFARYALLYKNVQFNNGTEAQSFEEN